ncbi:MAG: ABC transporter permease subunit [Bacilli bacterium]|jgi:ABC-type sugar transport system permease subunit|nr:ABC transporter permease subunit [Acholeplasmataceae bacterium]
MKNNARIEKLNKKIALLSARIEKAAAERAELLSLATVPLGKVFRLERLLFRLENGREARREKLSALETGAPARRKTRRARIAYLSPEAGKIYSEQIKAKKEKYEKSLDKATEKYIEKAKAKQTGQKGVSYRQVAVAGRKRERLKKTVQHYELQLLRLSEGKYQLLGFFGKIKRSFSQMPYGKQKLVFGLLFLTPWIIGFCIFFAVPVFTTISWSFQKLETVSGGGFKSTFVGFGNYRDLFTTATLAGSTISEVIVASVIDILLDLPTIIIFSLFIAALLNTRFKGHQLVKAIFFIPVVYNITVINNTLTGMFGQRFDSAITEGFNLSQRFAFFLQRIGVGGNLIDFLISAVDRIFTIVNMSGIQILMFIAALQSIPKHLYEAAKVEGATSYEMFWKITFPMVSPIIMTAIVFTIVNSFATSEIMNFMTVNSQGTTMATNNPGLYSAIAIIYFLANALIIAAAFVIMRKVVFYHDK